MNYGRGGGGHDDDRGDDRDVQHCFKRYK